MPSKTIEIIAGPNGSGKSTFAEVVLLKKLKVRHFINPDTIAAGLSPLDVEQAAFQAGRVMITAIKGSIKKGESFAFESTLSGKTWLPILRDAIQNDYQITIYFIFLEHVQENIRRIKKRHALGGHFIPSATVRRRYPKAFHNFWYVYRLLCSDWLIFNNSGRKPKQTHSRTSFQSLSIHDQQRFEAQFLRGKQA